MSDDAFAERFVEPTHRADYNPEDIQVLEGIEHVQKRPGMYIRDTSAGGLHQLVWEVVDNAVDEFMSGFGTHITVHIHDDNSITITDDGRGIPTGDHPKEGIPTVEVVLTMLGAGGKFESTSYGKTGGLHGVGVSVVNALSTWLEVEVCREGQVWTQRYEKGAKVTELVPRGKSDRTGTKIAFKPDPQYFDIVPEWNYSILANRFREHAFLNSGLQIQLIDDRTSKEELFYSEEGLVGFVKYLNEGKETLHSGVIELSGDKEGVQIDLAAQYTDDYGQTILTFANNINNYHGGTHLSGFRAAWTRALNKYAKQADLLKKDGKGYSGDDYREGVTAVMSVRLYDPKFKSQAKDELINPEVQGIADSIIYEHLQIFLEENPRIAKKIIKKAALAYKVRQAVRKARETTRKSILAGGGLPGKLADCKAKSKEGTELYLVEGDSAGGSAKQGRDPRFQAILPLRGKILNVEKATKDRVLNHNEIRLIIQALGAGFDEEFDPDKVRYDRIIIMTDADVDGSHIRTLLLTFFFRYMPQLIERGQLFIAQPPLYKIKRRRRETYIHDDEDMKQRLLDLGRDGTTLRSNVADRELTPEEFEQVLDLLEEVENWVRGLRRKGLSLQDFLKLKLDGNLPRYRVSLDGRTFYFYSSEEYQDFLTEEEEIRGLPPTIREGTKLAFDLSRSGKKQEGETWTVLVEEFHAGHELEDLFDELREYGISFEEVDPEKEEGAVRPYQLLTDRSEPVDIYSAEEILATVREEGQRGLTVQRYKGLGEMNPNQLWETTMDPENRTLVRVTLEEGGGAMEAHKLFSVLMGSAVGARRSYIEKHALEVKDLDV